MRTLYRAPGMGLMFVLVIIIVVGLTVPAARTMVFQVWTDFLQRRLGSTGVLALAEVVDVNIVAEGTDSRYELGPISIVQRDRHGRAYAPTQPRYRILLRFHTPQGLVVADLERELTTRELNVLNPEARIEIRYDPNEPDHVALEPTSLQELVRRAHPKP